MKEGAYELGRTRQTDKRGKACKEYDAVRAGRHIYNKDIQSRNTADKAAGVFSLLFDPKTAVAGINGDDKYNKMSANNKKQADAMFQLYKRLNDEYEAVSKQSAGKAWGSGVANAALNAAGAVENGARYVTSAAENALSGALKLAASALASLFSVVLYFIIPVRFSRARGIEKEKMK